MSYRDSLKAENDCLRQTLMDLSDHIIKDISKGDVSDNSDTAWAGFKAFLLLEQLNDLRRENAELRKELESKK